MKESLFKNKWSIITVLLLFSGVIPHIVEPIKGVTVDFQVYLEASKVYLSGEDPYSKTFFIKPVVSDKALPFLFYYPPIFLYIVVIIFSFTQEYAREFWLISSYLILFSVAWFWAKMFVENNKKLSFAKALCITSFLCVSFEPNFAGAL